MCWMENVWQEGRRFESLDWLHHCGPMTKARNLNCSLNGAQIKTEWGEAQHWLCALLLKVAWVELLTSALPV